MSKKSAALYLPKKELRSFECLYQGLLLFPGFRMENIFCRSTREHYAIHEQCPDVLRDSFGRPHSKLNVASHEAGHAVVMASIFTKIDAAIIYSAADQGGGYAGFVRPLNYMEPDLNIPPLEVAPKFNWLDVRISILIDIAGFVAECLYASGHSRAYHEKFSVYVQCRFLDGREGKQPLHHWNHFMSWCKRILTNNEDLFHQITEGLLKHETLPQKSIEKLHARIKNEPINSLFQKNY